MDVGPQVATATIGSTGSVETAPITLQHKFEGSPTTHHLPTFITPRHVVLQPTSVPTIYCAEFDAVLDASGTASPPSTPLFSRLGRWQILGVTHVPLDRLSTRMQPISTRTKWLIALSVNNDSIVTEDVIDLTFGVERNQVRLELAVSAAQAPTDGHE